MTVVVSSYISKGGTCKSSFTQAVSAATSILASDLKILVIDTDFQSNTTEVLSEGKIFNEEGFYSLMKYGKHVKPIPSKRNNLFFIPSSDLVSSLENELINKLKKEFVFKNLLEKYYSDFDICFIDCPPGINTSVINVLVASDYVVAPITPSLSCLTALGRLKEYVDDLNELELNKNLEIIITRNMFNHRTLIHKDINLELEKKYPNQLVKTTIPIGITTVEAAANYMDIFALDTYNEKKSKVSEAYLELTKEILTKLS